MAPSSSLFDMILVRIDLVLDACDCDDCDREVGQLGVELVCRKKMKVTTESDLGVSACCCNPLREGSEHT
jgi:hypothetical protein